MMFSAGLAFITLLALVIKSLLYPPMHTLVCKEDLSRQLWKRDCLTQRLSQGNPREPAGSTTLAVLRQESHLLSSSELSSNQRCF